jgi:hypothetical protein
METGNKVAAGQAVYTPVTLSLYDGFVLGFSNRFLWRCPTGKLEAMYRRHVSGNHLDVGVGTGYFLDQTPWPTVDPKITLVDLNSHSLEAAANRIERYTPRALVANILQQLPLLELQFESVGLCYLLHCLPGAMAEKAIVFDHVLDVMRDGAVVFGATIVQGDAPRSWAAQALMDFYNRKGIFCNAADTAQNLGAELEKRFNDVRLRQSGAVVMFEAKRE